MPSSQYNMALIYVDSNAAGSNNGTDWTNAFTAFASAVAAATESDTIYVAHNHAEVLSASTSYNLPTTSSFTPKLRILCVNTGTGALATTGSITTNGNFSLNFGNQGSAYVYGLVLTAGNSGAGTTKFISCGQGGQGIMVFESCTLRTEGTSTTDIFRMANAQSSRAYFINCTFRYRTTTQRFVTQGFVQIRNLTFATGGANDAIPALFTNSSVARYLELIDCDMSSYTGFLTFFSGGMNGAAAGFRITNCKFATGFTLISPTAINGTVYPFNKFHSNTIGTENKAFLELKAEGTVESELVIVRTGGASNGTTPISMKMVSTTLVNPYVQALESIEVFKWNDTTSSITVNIETVNDGVTLKNDELWMEVEYLNEASTLLNALSSTRNSTIETTPSDVPSSTIGWTTTGLTSPVKQKLSATFTPARAGLLRVRVYLARVSTTVYVDPKIEIT